METLRDIIASNGGLEFLPERSPIQLELDPKNFIQIADAGASPHGLQAVSLAFFRRGGGRKFIKALLPGGTCRSFCCFFHTCLRPHRVLRSGVYPFKSERLGIEFDENCMYVILLM